MVVYFWQMPLETFINRENGEYDLARAGLAQSHAKIFGIYLSWNWNRQVPQ